MSSSLKRYAPIALVVGVAGLVFAAAAWLLQRQFSVYVQASLALGLLGVAVAMLLNPGAIQVWLGGRQARYGGNALVMVVALFVIVFLLNYLAVHNPQRWDWSENQLNTLAPESLNVLEQITEPVQALAFYSTRLVNGSDTAQGLLEQYRIAADGKFTYEFHDPESDPILAREYGVDQDGMIVLQKGDLREVVSFASEDQITGALVRLASPASRVIYFLTGHGEMATDATEERGLSSVAEVLEGQNYELLPIDLLVTSTVPVDARAIVIAGPLVPVTQPEVDALKTYLTGGGALVVMLDPRIEMQSDLDVDEPLVDFLAAEWGVTLGNDLIVDLNNSYPNQPLYPLVYSYGTSVVTEPIEDIAVVFPIARSVKIPAQGESLANLTYVGLVAVHPEAWGEIDFSTQPASDDTDTQQPFYVAVTAENTVTKSRLVVFGDAGFASNDAAEFGANLRLLTGSINWVTVEESLVSLTPKIPTQRSLSLTNALTANLIFFLTVVIMPLIVLILGGVVWFQRRRHV